MAEISKFFNSAPGDPRTYQASDFADYFGSVLSTGLLHTDNIPALEVKCDGNDLRTYVTPGKAIIQGYLYENTSDLYLEHALPEPTLDRIDRIVLRLDKRNQSRYIRLFVKQGTPDENPVPPELQRDDFIYELSLAQIRVRANTSTLNPADLIDERLDENLCGLVHSLISIPTSQFQQMWNDFFNAKEQEWEDWFANVQNSGFETPSGAQQKANQAEANAKAYTDTAPEPMQRNLGRFNKYKSGKDSNGIYTTVEYKRSDGTLYAKSVLSGGTSPQYTTRTITYYDTDGTTVIDTVTYNLIYDTDGNLKDEVLA